MFPYIPARYNSGTLCLQLVKEGVQLKKMPQYRTGGGILGYKGCKYLWGHIPDTIFLASFQNLFSPDLFLSKYAFQV